MWDNRYIGRIIFVLILIFTAGAIVYFAGGTASALTHLMYIPIILSAYYFGVAGAAGAALVGGLIVGPLMPVSISAGVMQQHLTWLLRSAMFTTVGVVVSVLFEHVKKYKKSEIERLYRNAFTGLPNMNKMMLDLNDMIGKNTAFSLIGFRIINMDDINRFADYKIGVKAIKMATDVLGNQINGEIYSLFTNEFAAILPNTDIENAGIIGKRFLDTMCCPLSVDNFSIELLVKGGIVTYPLQSDNAYDLIRKVGIALSQKANEIGLFIYDNKVEQRDKKRSEVVVALFNAIKNDEFHLVYQPITNLSDNRELCVEALLRWDRGADMEINTGEVIQLAEELGIINEITRWVIKNVIAQVKKWRDEGLAIKVAMNVSSKDLRNHSIINYLMQSIEESALDPALFEIELTERSILENEENVRQLLYLLRGRGIKISLDDFGTGYNSLIDLVKIPKDHVKIDKMFIDGITDDINKLLIENIVGFAHNTGRKVIAEGVETKEQFDILKAMGCDYIQGYYVSRPLPPEVLKEFYFKEPASV
jgi:EAL domain-containing protein (putative c-di-GMP-specific phosphodiesterase class I)